MRSYESKLWCDASGMLSMGTRSVPLHGCSQKWWQGVGEVVDGLFLTCEEEVRDRARCQELGISLLLKMCATTNDPPFTLHQPSQGFSDAVTTSFDCYDQFMCKLDDYTSCALTDSVEKRALFVRAVAAVDLPTYDISQHFAELCTLIELVLANRQALADTCGCKASALPSVLVYCMAGVSRSAAVVIAYIMKKVNFSPAEALDFVRVARPVANPNCGFTRQLEAWRETRYLRMPDAHAAHLLGHELTRSSDAVTRLRALLRAILLSGRYTAERMLFGALLKASELSERKIIAVLTAMHRLVHSAVHDEIYVDAPSFFDYFCEVVHSVQSDAPAIFWQQRALTVFPCATENRIGMPWHDLHGGDDVYGDEKDDNCLSTKETMDCHHGARKDADKDGTCDARSVHYTLGPPLVWNDMVYTYVLQDLVCSALNSDMCSVARAVCSLLKAMHTRHISPACGGLQAHHVYSHDTHHADLLSISISFPILPYVVLVAEGFVNATDLAEVRDTHIAIGDDVNLLSDDQSRRLALTLVRLFCSSFLSCNAGACDDVVLRQSNRWHGSHSYLSYLRSDIEVAAFELAERSEVCGVTKQLHNVIKNTCNADITRTVMYKIIGGVLAFHLLVVICAQLALKLYGAYLPPTFVSHYTEISSVLSVVNLISLADSLFQERFAESLNSRDFFRCYLERARACGLVPCDVNVTAIFASN